MKSQGESGIVKEYSIIFYPSQGKSRKANYLVYISLSLALCMVVCKVVVPFLNVSKCDL